MKNHIFALLTILIVVICTFWFFPNTFFQQDEWAIFGNMVYTKLSGDSLLGVILPQSGLSHFAPFTRIVTRITFDLFGLSFYPYAMLSICIHTLNSFLVYVLAYLLFRNRLVSVLAGVFFATNANTHQATTWIATNIGTGGCATFLLLSVIFFFVSVERKSARYMIFSAIAWFVSLGFKESSFFLFPMIVIYWFIRNKSIQIRRSTGFFLPFIISFLIYAGIRLVIAISAPPPPGPTEAYTQPEFLTLAYRLLFLPFKSFVQVLVPIQYLLLLSSGLIHLSYPQFLVDGKVPDPYIVESVAVDIVMFLLTVVFFTLIFVAIYMMRGKKHQGVYTVLLFCLLYVPLSVVLLIFVGGRAGYQSLIEPRNLYYAAVGSSILLSLSIWLVSNTIQKFIHIFSLRVIAFMFSIIVIGINIRFIRGDLRILESRSSIRKNILSHIVSKYPSLPDKVIFYTESDTAYYGMAPEETIMPFQSGFGQTLLVWYFGHGQKYPICFFDYHEDYLYAIESQGYRECGGRGFGYFRSYDELLTSLRNNKIPPDAVIAFSWKDRDRLLSDETREIRQSLTNDL